MSFPLREGTGTFPHAALKNSWFDPTKPELFYSHILIEVVTNCSYDTNWRSSNLKYPPVGVKTGKECEYLNHAFRNAHIRLRDLDIFYGTKSCDIRRGFLYTAPFNYDTIRDRTGNTDVYYIPVPMPTSEERCLWILLSFPIRAIYLPRAHYTDNKSNKDKCTYYGLILRQKDLKLKIGPESEQNRKTLHLPVKEDLGWDNLHSQYVACFDIQKMAARAVLPDELVKDEYQDIYQWIHVEHDEKVEKSYVHSNGRTAMWATYPKVKTPQGWYTESTMNMCERGVKLTKVVSKIYGVELKGANEPSEWLVDVLMGCTAVAVGLIPVVGPLAAVGVYVLMEAILKPEVFTDDVELKKQVPLLVAGVLESSKLLKPFVKLSKIKAFQKIAKDLPKHTIQVVKQISKLPINKSVVSKATLAGSGGALLLLTKTEPPSGNEENGKTTDKKNVSDENKKRDQDTKKIGGQMKAESMLQASSMPE